MNEMEEIVDLNVGGTYFTTTKQTLLKFPDSMLATMFGGDIPTKQDRKGRYFIDRNGRLFEHILSFLRLGELILPDNFSEISLLEREADFYQIKPLIEAINDYKCAQFQEKESEKEKRTILYCTFISSFGKQVYVFAKSRFSEYQLVDNDYKHRLGVDLWNEYLEKHCTLVMLPKLDYDSLRCYLLSLGIDCSFLLGKSSIDITIWSENDK